MKFKLIKDQNLRIKYNKQEKEILLNKFMYTNLLNKNYVQDELIVREIGLFLAEKLERRVSKTELVRRCAQTGRSRVNYSKKLKISRIKMREIIRSGIFPVFKKALW